MSCQNAYEAYHAYAASNAAYNEACAPLMGMSGDFDDNLQDAQPSTRDAILATGATARHALAAWRAVYKVYATSEEYTPGVYFDPR